MKRLNTLGLLAVAAMAVAAFVGTSAASATTSGSFTAEKSGLALETSVVKQHVFVVTGSEVKCNKVTFTGTTEGAETTSQKVTPKYEECTAFGFSATVTNTNCVIKLTATTSGEKGSAEAHLEGTNCKMTIKVDNVFAKCDVDVLGQSVKGIKYSPGANSDVVVSVASGATMNAQVTESSGLCPLTVGTHNNASYTGEETVKVAGGVSFMEMASAGAP